MFSFGTCKLCGEKIGYSPDQLQNYGKHLMEKHPQAEFAHFALMYEPGGNASKMCVCGCGCKRGKCGRGIPKRTQSYKTSRWKNGGQQVQCTKCGKVDVPLIKRQRHKICSSNWFSYLILACWPICFLPFIISGSDLFYFYCRHCGHFIGVYDRRMSVAAKYKCSCK